MKTQWKRNSNNNNLIALFLKLFRRKLIYEERNKETEIK